MSRIIKTSEKIILDSPEIDFITPLIKLNTIPTINNANIQYLTRNAGTGNLEVVNTLPTIYNANGTLTSSRTISGGASNNLTFSGGFGTFTIGIWSNIVINGITITSNSDATSSFNSTNVLNLGTTTPTTNLSATTRTLNINSTTTKLSNVSFKPNGPLAGQYLFVDSGTKELRAENIPTAGGAARVLSTASGILLTSGTPVDVSGPSLTYIIMYLYDFSNTGSGLQYNITHNAATYPIMYFKIELLGNIRTDVTQDYSVVLLINGIPSSLSLNTITCPASAYTLFSTQPIIEKLVNGDEVRFGLGRSTSNATVNFTFNLVITPISYYDT